MGLVSLLQAADHVTRTTAVEVVDGEAGDEDIALAMTKHSSADAPSCKPSLYMVDVVCSRIV